VKYKTDYTLSTNRSPVLSRTLDIITQNMPNEKRYQMKVEAQ